MTTTGVIEDGGHRSVRLRGAEIGLIAGIVLLDQITKAVVRARIPLYETVPVVGGVLNLSHVRNSGAAF